MSRALSYVNPLRLLARWWRRPGQQAHAHDGHCYGFPGEPECCITERKR